MFRLDLASPLKSPLFSSIFIVLLLALLVSGCTNPPPPMFPIQERPDPLESHIWRFRFLELRVENPQEDRRLVNISVSNGDEPYLILLGFKADLGVTGSTVFKRNVYNNDEWAENLKAGGIQSIPIPMGVLDFPDVTRNSVIGILAVAMESDRTPWQVIENRVATIRQSITAIARQEVENRSSPIDPSNISFVDNIQQSILEASTALNPTLLTTEAAENIIFSGVDTDEVIGMNAMVFMYDPPTGGLALPHYIPPYFVDALVPNKVYPLGSSTQTIRFENEDLDALYFTSLILQRGQ